jgi:hypothetical protein
LEKITQKYIKNLIVFISRVVFICLFLFCFLFCFAMLGIKSEASSMLHKFFRELYLQSHHIFLDHFPYHQYVTSSEEQRISGTSDKAGEVTLMCLVVVKM